MRRLLIVAGAVLALALPPPGLGQQPTTLRAQLRTLFSAPISLRRMGERATLIASSDRLVDCARVTAPTLVVTGETGLDHVVPVGGSSEYVDLIRGARAVTLEGTGHLGSVTRADRFARVVEDFVRNAADAAA